MGQHRAAGAQPRLQGNPRSALEEATQLRHTVLLGARHREQGGSSPTRSFLTSLLLFTPQSTKETHQSCQPPCGYRGLQFPLGPVEGVAHNCRKRDSEVLLPPASPPPCPETCSQAGGFASFLPSAPGTTSSLLPPKHSKQQSPPFGVGRQKGHIFPTTAAGPLANRSPVDVRFPAPLLQRARRTAHRYWRSKNSSSAFCSFLQLHGPRSRQKKQVWGGREAPSRSRHLTATGWLCSELLKSKPCPIPAGNMFLLPWELRLSPQRAEGQL